MRVKIMSWNVRGANDLDRRKIIRNVIRIHRANLVCFQETKIQKMTTVVARSLGVGRNYDWRALDAEGTAGGILLFWDKKIMELVDSEIGLFSISCLFKMVEGGVHWMFSGVYGPVERNLKEIFWEELGGIRGWWEGPWCLSGDFNEILSPSERVRGGNITPSMRRFVEIVNELGLRDLPLQRGPYTWSWGRNERSMSRLDRFLVSSDWECQYSKVVQKCLPRPISDHFPILLDSDGVRTGPSPFRFELMWLKFRGFKELLKGWWQNLKFHGSFSYILAAKLKALKGILKSWNMEVFGRVEVKKKEALQRVSFWDGLEKQRELILEEREEKIRAKGEFKSLAVMEEISWRQKSRELWLKDGDKNTGYFHKMANAHRRRNCLGKFSINGKMLEKEAEIKVGLIEAFKNLFSAPSEWRPSLPDLSFDEIGLENATKLEEDFSEEEIWTAISGLNGDKALGPDGFPLLFGPSVGILLRQRFWVSSRNFMNKVNLLEALMPPSLC